MVFPPPESLSPSQFQILLVHLRSLLHGLPHQLPVGDAETSVYRPFLSFSIDEELLDRTGSEIGALNEQFKAIFGWKTRTTGDGYLPIQERGKPITAIADVLERFQQKYPDDNVLRKWGVDVANSILKVYDKHGVVPPDPPCSKSAPQVDCSVGQLKDKHSRSSDSVAGRSNRSETIQSDSVQVMGRPLNPLMKKLILKTMGSTDGKSKVSWRCIAPACDHIRQGNPQEARVLKHASSCPHLDSHLKREAIEASKAGSLGSQLREINSDAHLGVTTTDEPPFKKSKGQSHLDLATFRQAGRKKNEEDRKAFQARIDHIIVRLICVRGLPPSIVDSAEWKELMTALNPSYTSTSCSHFTDNYIPKEAVFVRQQQLDMLRKHHDLTLTFDGTSTRKPHSLYTVHATTPERKTYFLDGYEDSTARHTTEWIKDKLLKTIHDVGKDKWAGICSDSTRVTKNARRDIAASIPTILDLNDACHHLHNTIKDITTLPEFELMLSLLRPIISHFSKSTLSVAHLRKERRVDDDEPVNMLQKIGKTRFGTHWLAATSLVQCFPNIHKLVEKRVVKFKSSKVQDMFLNRFSYMTMDNDMGMYIEIIAPFIRSLWALEASHANAADVFIFWMAIGATLQELFAKGTNKTGIPSSLAQRVTAIFNTRWKEFFSNDIYFTTFALDPRYPLSDFIMKPSLAPPTIRIPPRNVDTSIHATSATSFAGTATSFGRPPIPHPRAYERVKNFLKKILRYHLEYYESNPAADDQLSTLTRELTPATVIDNFRQQLESYWRHEWPFDIPVSNNDSFSWWTNLRPHPHAHVLATLAIKLFAILPNSMPDERTGSTMTWLNSPLRANQNPQTLIDMIQVGQWYRGQDRGETRPRKEPFRPVVKFREFDKDLLRAIALGEQGNSSGDVVIPSSVGNAESEDELGDFDDEMPPFESASINAAYPEEGSIHADEDISLTSPALLDILAPEPRGDVTLKQPVVSTMKKDHTVRLTDADWDF